MNIYIPQYLRSIPVVDQLYRMILGYSKIYQPDTNSFDSWRLSLTSDPVDVFVRMCVKEDEFIATHKDQDYEVVINYLVKLFYSVKGTSKVFEYMKKYLNLSIVGDIIYTVKTVEITFQDLSVTDEEMFYTSLINFLNSLIIFEEVRTNIGTIKLDIRDDITKYLQADLIPYKNYTFS